jgi:hypothetical protein
MRVAHAVATLSRCDPSSLLGVSPFPRVGHSTPLDLLRRLLPVEPCGALATIRHIDQAGAFFSEFRDQLLLSKESQIFIARLEYDAGGESVPADDMVPMAVPALRRPEPVALALSNIKNGSGVETPMLIDVERGSRHGSALGALQAQCGEGAQVRVAEVASDRSRLQELEQRRHLAPAETRGDQCGRSVKSVQVVERVQAVELTPGEQLRLRERVDLAQRLAEREA